MSLEEVEEDDDAGPGEEWGRCLGNGVVEASLGLEQVSIHDGSFMLAAKFWMLQRDGYSYGRKGREEAISKLAVKTGRSI